MCGSRDGLYAQMKNPVFPAVILAERFARLDFLKLANVKCGTPICTALEGLSISFHSK